MSTQPVSVVDSTQCGAQNAMTSGDLRWIELLSSAISAPSLPAGTDSKARPWLLMSCVARSPQSAG